MKVLFAGSPAFAVPALQALIDNHHVVGVLSQPDKPRGRGQTVSAAPVKQVALERNIPILQPQKLKSPETQQALRDWQADIMVVCAYGRLLPPALLTLTRLHAWNIHASLLPRWRGAAPIERCLYAGDEESGISIMKMAEGMDTGDVLLRLTEPTAHHHAQSLTEALAKLGAIAILQALDLLAQGEVQTTKQEDTLATHASKLHSDEFAIPWQLDANTIDRHIRAFYPRSFSYIGDTRIKVLSAQALPGEGPPGEILANGPEGLIVGTGEGLIQLQTLQFPGKKPQNWQQLRHGYQSLCQPSTLLHG